MIVSKFGGTSVKDHDAMVRVADILHKDRKPVLAVLSACSGITDKLIETAESAASGDQITSKNNCEFIRHHHIDIIKSVVDNKSSSKDLLKPVEELCDELDKFIEGIILLRELTPRRLDSVLSFGEILSTTVFTSILKSKGTDAVFYDARNILRKKRIENSRPYIDTNLKEFNDLKQFIKEHDVVVTQGFIGRDEHSFTVTIGRGGSDYSASLFGAALNAEEIKIWTDVSGILSSDPRLIPTAGTIKNLNFEEVKEMAFFGAKVLHPEAIKPAIEKNIPVKILNTYKPDHNGTVINKNNDNGAAKVKTLVYKENCPMISAGATLNEYPELIMRDYLQRLHDIRAVILSASISENRIRFILDKYCEDEPGFNSIIDNENVETKKVNLIALCGKGISSVANFSHIYSKIKNSIEKLPVKLLLYGTSENSILIYTEDNIPSALLQEIHDQTIQDDIS